MSSIERIFFNRAKDRRLKERMERRKQGRKIRPVVDKKDNGHDKANLLLQLINLGLREGGASYDTSLQDDQIIPSFIPRNFPCLYTSRQQ